MSSLIPISRSVAPTSHSVTPQPPLHSKKQGPFSRMWGAIQRAFGVISQPPIAPIAPKARLVTTKEQPAKEISIAEEVSRVVPLPIGELVAEYVGITPKEQLKRLELPIAKEVSCVVPLSIGKLVAAYALDESFTNWYTAYDRLESLPTTVPPLPRDIYQIMYSPCPIYGASHRVKDTHFLSLISEEFGSLTRMQENVLTPYGKRTYLPEGAPSHPIRHNPLFFNSSLFYEVRKELLDAPLPVTHFVLMTKGLLPGSQEKSLGEQEILVAQLSQYAGVAYEIPTYQQALTAIVTYMVATEERLYPFEDGQDIDTLTRVRQITQSLVVRQIPHSLVVGRFTPTGVFLACVEADAPGQGIGIAALREFC